MEAVAHQQIRKVHLTPLLLESGHCDSMPTPLSSSRRKISFGSVGKRLIAIWKVSLTPLFGKVSLKPLLPLMRRGLSGTHFRRHCCRRVKCCGKTKIPPGARSLKGHVTASCASGRSARWKPKARRHLAWVGLLWLSSLGLLSTLASCGSPPEDSHTQDAKDDPVPLDSDVLNAYDFGKIGFIDRSGTLAVKPAFYGAGDFAANGLAPVQLDPPSIKSLEEGGRWQCSQLKPTSLRNCLPFRVTFGSISLP
jgi:hypothetical protein